MQGHWHDRRDAADAIALDVGSLRPERNPMLGLIHDFGISLLQGPRGLRSPALRPPPRRAARLNSLVCCSHKKPSLGEMATTALGVGWGGIAYCPAGSYIAADCASSGHGTHQGGACSIGGKDGSGMVLCQPLDTSYFTGASRMQWASDDSGNVDCGTGLASQLCTSGSKPNCDGRYSSVLCHDLVQDPWKIDGMPSHDNQIHGSRGNWSDSWPGGGHLNNNHGDIAMCKDGFVATAMCAGNGNESCASWVPNQLRFASVTCGELKQTQATMVTQLCGSLS